MPNHSVAIRAKLFSIAFGGAIVFGFCGLAVARHGAALQTIYEFSGYDGKAKGQGKPSQPLVPDGHGGFYGVGIGGLGGRGGNIFRLNPPTASNPQWTELTLHVFGAGFDGFGPNGLVIGHDGDLYGTTYAGGYFGSNFCQSLGGCGVVYRLRHPADRGGHWTEEVLHAFRNEGDGAYPGSGLVAGSDGAYYGTTEFGTVYALYPPVDPRGGPGSGWHTVVLHTFEGTLGPAGYNVYAGLAIDSSGNLYGANSQGGMPTNGGGGTVFKLVPRSRPPWTLEILHTFHGAPSDGYTPYASLILGSGGAVLGTTSSGGTANGGVVFRLTPAAKPGEAWHEDILFNATSSGLEYESGVVMDSSGALYVTALNHNGPCVYKLTPSDGPTFSHTILHEFPPSDGVLPTPLVDASAVLYGTTRNGGAAGAGSVYTLTQ